MRGSSSARHADRFDPLDRNRLDPRHQRENLTRMARSGPALFRPRPGRRSLPAAPISDGFQ